MTRIANIADDRDLQPQQIMFLHALSKLATKAPHKMGRFLEADDFDMLADHLKDVAEVMDAYVAAIMRIAQEHSHVIPTDAFTTTFSDAVHDGPGDALKAAAAEWTRNNSDEALEDARADSWRGLHRAS